MGKDKPVVLIMCGGKSQRLWPLSENKSKNFLDVLGFSPLEYTIKRFLKITPCKNIFLVANRKEAKHLKSLNIIKRENIFFEPQSRNTAAAVCLSLCYLKSYFHPRKPIVITPVDHLITKEDKFYNGLNVSLAAAAKGYLCTLGIKPKDPSSDFGYIQSGKRISKNVYYVKRFIEKPSLPVARKLIKKGGVFYNSGMFIASLDTLKQEYKTYYPYYNDFAQAVKAKSIEGLYKRLPSSPFDKTIMEHTKKSALVKGDFSWCDFGTWPAIWQALAKDKNGNAKKGRAYFDKSSNSFIYLEQEKKSILALGLKNIFFIDTGRYALIAHRSFLDNIKTALKEFRRHGFPK
ncbi:MAG: sugar phosphate nucleotidyltransferase [Candidatus Omnitrophota bacterium]